jgi:erythromycin esterase
LSAPATEQAVLGWLRQNAIPIQHLEAGHGFADLQPLKPLLQDVKVVGLGEATHGTREFFQIKHRLLEFLVIEMGFTAFAIEASYAACQPINDYVLHGVGDLATALTGQGYVPWDTQEFVEMVAWLRAYNQRVPDAQKVKFVGADLWRNDLGRQAVLDYLRNVGSEQVAATELLFEALAREEAKWPASFDEETPMILAQLLPQIDDLINYLTANQAALIGGSSPADFESALQYTRIMRQWLLANTPDSLRPSYTGKDGRSMFMGQNLIYLIDRDKPGAKYVVWAHNAHVSLETPSTGEPNWGHCLRERYGQGYFAFGFEFGQGSFQTRTAPGQGLGDLKAVTLPPAPTGSWPWYLTQANRGDLILNLRTPAGNPAIEAWLNAPRRVRHANWGYDEKSTYGYDVNLRKTYDGVIFIERTTPTRPTANALQTVARRAWL